MPLDAATIGGELMLMQQPLLTAAVADVDFSLLLSISGNETGIEVANVNLVGAFSPFKGSLSLQSKTD